MNEDIRKYVNDLFVDKPNTKRVNDMKEEIISNTNDKYTDLIETGVSSEEAFQKVIQEIGDVSELINEIEKSNPMNIKANEEERKKSALVVTIAVGLYILSMISIMITEELGLPEVIGMISFFVIAGAATCLLIYHYMSKPKYKKYDETIVEEFKEWKHKEDNKKEIKSSINAIIWTATVALYFVLSFVFGIWHLSWILFLIAVLIQNIVRLLFKLGEK